MSGIDIDNINISPEVKELLPYNFIIENKILPFQQSNGKVKFFVVEHNTDALDMVEKIIDKTVVPVKINRSQFAELAGKYFEYLPDTVEKDSRSQRKYNLELTSFEINNKDKQLEKSAGNGAVINIVNRLLLQAGSIHASDIHIEPFEKKIVVRIREDGVLQEQRSIPKKFQNAIASRIKIMANLDITITKKPQDGRIKITIDDKKFDIRVSTIPTIYGENIVLRLLNKDVNIFDFDKLGFRSALKKEFEKLITCTHGIILVTGPTGSGKTTTLYTSLLKLNRPGVKIATVEDPVEYEIEGINQTHINRKIDLTFSKGLRSLLRQDPDILMVGEIRDFETAEIAIQAALTGHLVFSTIHTNNSFHTLTRLFDIGVKPFLIADTVRGILAQRLVRRLCGHCRKKSIEEKRILEEAIKEKLDNIDIYESLGCSQCSGTGYSGRTGIYELLLIDDDIRAVIKASGNIKEISDHARKKGMLTLMEAGLLKVKDGITSMSEVLRVVHE